MKLKYKMGLYGGLFDLIIKNNTYRNMYNNYEGCDMKGLKLKYIKNVLVPYFEKSIDAIMNETYQENFITTTINFKFNKSDYDKYIMFTFEGNEDDYTYKFLYTSIETLISDLYYHILNDTNVVTHFEKQTIL